MWTICPFITWTFTRCIPPIPDRIIAGDVVPVTRMLPPRLEEDHQGTSVRSCGKPRQSQGPVIPSVARMFLLLQKVWPDGQSNACRTHDVVSMTATSGQTNQSKRNRTSSHITFHMSKVFHMSFLRSMLIAATSSSINIHRPRDITRPSTATPER